MVTLGARTLKNYCLTSNRGTDWRSPFSFPEWSSGITMVVTSMGLSQLVIFIPDIWGKMNLKGFYKIAISLRIDSGKCRNNSPALVQMMHMLANRKLKWWKRWSFVDTFLDLSSMSLHLTQWNLYWAPSACQKCCYIRRGWEPNWQTWRMKREYM